MHSHPHPIDDSGHGHDHSHAHGHEHHGHHHGPIHLKGDVSKAFVVGIILNAVFVIVEGSAGFYYDSLALLTDAGHNLSDVAGLIIAYIAYILEQKTANDRFTYGYRKVSILSALTNSIFILIAMGALAYEAVFRLFTPHSVPGLEMSLVAGVGVVINLSSAFLFFRSKDHDLNTKGAWLHLLTDAIVSMGVIISGIVIYFTGWNYLDAIISLVISIVILVSVWGLLKESLHLSIDAVPKDIDTQKVKSSILAIDGVISLHHLHLWSISASQNALTAHIVLRSDVDPERTWKIKSEIKHILNHLNILHCTLETELEQENCSEYSCNDNGGTK